MKKVLLALLLLPLSFALAQPPDTLWTRVYDQLVTDCEARDMLVTADGGFVVAGGIIGATNGSFLMLTDEQGNPEMFSMQQLQGMSLYSIQKVLTGGFLAVGVKYQSTYGDDASVVRLNEQGDTLWTRSYDRGDDEYLFDLAPAADDGFIAVGRKTNGSWSRSALLVFRFDENGDTLWTREYTESSMGLHGYSVVTCENGFAVGGMVCQGLYFRGMLLQRIFPNGGDIIWRRFYPEQSEYPPDLMCYAQTIHALDDGGFLLVGSQGFTTTLPDGIAVVRTDSAGDTLWTRSMMTWNEWPMISNASAADVVEIAGGDFVIAGSFARDYSEYRSICLIRMTANGDTVWTRSYYGSGPLHSLQPYAMAITEDGGYAIAGMATASPEYPGGTRHIFLMRTEPDPLGAFHSTQVFIPDDERIRIVPNPFNPSTALSFTLPRQARARLAVYDVLGREVRVLADENFAPGEHRILFDGSDLPSGIYFARLQSSEFVATQKLLLLK
ncbi:MAG: T9SS type A sorting domain-containing protein [bacterium]|nr:T9SS type A sorting domain-containing protein [bacterium]